MIRIDHLTLPAGLDAIARRVGPAELHVVVSDSLDPRQQRIAVRTAVRAARRRAWEFGVLPLPVAAAGAVTRGPARQLTRLLRAHGAVSAVTGTLAAGAAAATAAIFIVAAPHSHGHPAAIAPNSPGYTQPPGAGTYPAPGGQPGAPAHRQSGSTGQRVVTVSTPSAGTPHPGPAPSPGQDSTSPPSQTSPPTTSTWTSSPPQPQPTPSGSSTSPPSSGGGATCVVILGIEVCL